MRTASRRQLRSAGRGGRTLFVRAHAARRRMLRRCRALERGRPEHLPDHRCVLDDSFSAGASASSRAAIIPCTVSGSGSSSGAAAGRPRSAASARTPRRRADCLPHADHRRPAPPPGGALARAARRGAAPSRRRTAPDRERRRVSLAAAPAAAAVEQLGPRRRDDQHRHVRGPFREVVDEVEQAVVRPVQILEDEHERAALGDRLEEAPPRRERLACGGRSIARRAREPGQRPHVPLDPSRLDSSGDLATRRATLPRPLRRRRVSRIPACALTISPSAQ